MRQSRLTAATLSLLGAGMCIADELPPAGPDPAAESAGSPELVFSDYRPADSTLLPQINVVLAALIASKAGAQGSSGVDELAIEVVDVNAMDSTLAGVRSSAAGRSLCRHMARPGSRIMRERCFDETAAEAAFNDYRYQREIEQMREQNARDFLEVAEYGLAYRRSLAEQE
jgi:hypothetical protein